MRRSVWMAGVLLLLTAGFAMSQEATPQASNKAKPTAGRVSLDQATVTPITKATPVEPAAAPAATAQRAMPAPTKAEPVDDTPTVAAPARSATVEMPAAKAQAAIETTDVVLPTGTTVRMKLETMLSTMTNKGGDSFAGRVTQPVTVNGRTLIPVGASVEGRVARTNEPRRIKGVPVIDIRPESVTMPNGDRYAMSAAVIDTSDPKKLHVTEEGAIKGSGHDRTDLRDAAIGAGGGLTIGALVNGKRGALEGAAVGATAAFVRWMSRRHSETIPAGTELFLELSRPMAMSGAGAAGR